MEWIMTHTWTSMECSDREFCGDTCGQFDFEKKCTFENCPEPTKKRKYRRG